LSKKNAASLLVFKAFKDRDKKLTDQRRVKKFFFLGQILQNFLTLKCTFCNNLGCLSLSDTSVLV